MLENLNSEQYEAVTSVDNHVCIIAGAGSGKTRVITTRIAHLIQHHGIKDYRILAITFTNRAANEMKERLEKLVPNSNINAMTIHALCVRILREEIKHLGYSNQFTILDTDDQKRIISNIIKDKKIEMDNYKVSDVISFISNNKIENISTSEVYKYSKTDRSKLFAMLYEKYEKRLVQLQSLDFNDLLLFARKVLLIEEVRLKWQKRFSFIHVDEFQDVDGIQYDIIKLLISDQNNLCVVGDPDQCIYTWRGAKIQYILEFKKDFLNSKTIILHQNYRSTQEILNAANSLIEKNKNRIDKNLISNNDKGTKVIHFSGSNETEETSFIVEKIKKLKKEGNSYNEIAVLYRSNFSSRSIEKALVDAKIPYTIQGSIHFFERAEIKDALSYLKMMIDSSAIDLAFDRIINVPRRGIGDKTLSNIREISINENVSMYDVIKKYHFTTGKIKKSLENFVAIIEKYRNKLSELKLHKLLGMLLAEIGYYAMLQDVNDEERLENLKSLLQDIENYESRYPENGIAQYLQEVALYSEKREQDVEAISLMSIHSAKGNEFDFVFIFNMSEGIFPSDRSVLDSEIEEERRIAYVAMTRARKQLFLCESRGFHFNRDKMKSTSRFIKEIDSRYLSSELKTISSKIPISKMGSAISLAKGSKIVHDHFGNGIVVAIEGNLATIAFSHPHGIKKLLATHPSIKKR